MQTGQRPTVTWAPLSALTLGLVPQLSSETAHHPECLGRWHAVVTTAQCMEWSGTETAWFRSPGPPDNHPQAMTTRYLQGRVCGLALEDGEWGGCLALADLWAWWQFGKWHPLRWLSQHPGT